MQEHRFFSDLYLCPGNSDGEVEVDNMKEGEVLFFSVGYHPQEGV